jgi:hypothetical protein
MPAIRDVRFACVINTHAESGVFQAKQIAALVLNMKSTL